MQSRGWKGNVETYHEGKRYVSKRKKEEREKRKSGKIRSGTVDPMSQHRLSWTCCLSLTTTIAMDFLLLLLLVFFAPLALFIGSNVSFHA
jgi:hypothetical protein